MQPQKLLEELLTIRGIHSHTDQQNFLHPKYENLFDPFLMHDMERAVMRIFTAVAHEEKICIYSDYDADGIPGAVILHDFFNKIGYKNFYNYIPHRHLEGYGLHIPAIEKIADEGTTLMITVDLGITAVDEVIIARDKGIDVIITDHHEPLEKIPEAYAIVNPKLGSYPDPMLCGAGVAFKLVQALVSFPSLPRGGDATASSDGGVNKTQPLDSLRSLGTTDLPVGWEKWLLDMAGLATLSDMVPLQNENRIIAFFGMKVLQKTPRPGLQSLFQRSGISLQHLTEEDIVFSITPKLNAAGRMAHPMDAFLTLAAQNNKEGMIAAEHLTKLNDERKKVVAKIMREVHKKILARKNNQDMKQVLVIGDPAWPAGILGLIASKITEAYNITTFVWGSDEDIIKGSVRGIGDVSVVTLMQSVAHLLVQFGGHEDAGGFSATRETIHFLEQSLHEAFEHTKHEISKQVTTIVPDKELSITDITLENYYSIRQLAPFGVGNKKPIFSFRDVVIKQVRQFGKTTEHLEIIVTQQGVPDTVTIKAISWYANSESFTQKIETGKTMTLLGEFDFSVFRGKSELRLKIVDVL